MDTQQSNEMEESKGLPAKNSASRFSRRKVIQSGLAVSPLLFSVKSPVAWGADLNACNVSTLVSGNVSRQNECDGKTINPESPGYWHTVFHSSPNKGGNGSKYKVRMVLADNFQVYDYTKFSTLTNLNTLLSNISVALGSMWTITLSGSSQDPVMSAIFPDGGSSNHFDFVINIYNSSTGSSTDVNLTSSIPNFHSHTAGACLNGLFSGVINGYFTYAQVIQLLYDALLDVCQNITASLGSNPPTAINSSYIVNRLGETSGFLEDVIAW